LLHSVNFSISGYGVLRFFEKSNCRRRHVAELKNNARSCIRHISTRWSAIMANEIERKCKLLLIDMTSRGLSGPNTLQKHYFARYWVLSWSWTDFQRRLTHVGDVFTESPPSTAEIMNVERSGVACRTEIDDRRQSSITARYSTLDLCLLKHTAAAAASNKPPSSYRSQTFPSCRRIDSQQFSLAMQMQQKFLIVNNKQRQSSEDSAVCINVSLKPFSKYRYEILRHSDIVSSQWGQTVKSRGH